MKNRAHFVISIPDATGCEGRVGLVLSSLHSLSLLAKSERRKVRVKLNRRDLCCTEGELDRHSFLFRSLQLSAVTCEPSSVHVFTRVASSCPSLFFFLPSSLDDTTGKVAKYGSEFQGCRGGFLSRAAAISSLYISVSPNRF